MGGSASTVSTEAPRVGNVKISTSVYGLAVPMLWGQPRVPGNLVWLDGFKTVQLTTTTTSGGKGGGGGVAQQSISYKYYADCLMALGYGQVLGVASAWKGKKRIDGVTVAGLQDPRTAAFTPSDAAHTLVLTLANKEALIGTLSVYDTTPTSSYETGFGGDGAGGGSDGGADGAGNSAGGDGGLGNGVA